MLNGRGGLSFGLLWFPSISYIIKKLIQARCEHLIKDSRPCFNLCETAHCLEKENKKKKDFLWIFPF